MAATVERPTDEAALARLVGQAFVTRTPIEIRGGGSKSPVGAPVEASTAIEIGEIAGITLHEPAELVVGAKAGTPLAALVATLDQSGQMLPFEPADFRALLGTTQAEPTVGGLVAANASGPRRIVAGACRDSLIGLRFVNGRGEMVKSGGRVMKNVTGYDLVKLIAGAWGTLGVVTEATFKVLPKPEAEATLAFRGLDEAAAVALMSEALGSPFEVTAAAHLPGLGDAQAETLLRLEHFSRFLDYRAGALGSRLDRFGTPERLDGAASTACWRAIRDCRRFVGRDGAVWRISVAPSKAPRVVAALRTGVATDLFLDWGGGLVWALAPEIEAAAAAIRAAAREAGGHAMLMRGGVAYRQSHGGLAPPPALAALTGRVKAAFDPADILNRGRLSL
jgi:glycolate oxidase FAD binding subunit